MRQDVGGDETDRHPAGITRHLRTSHRHDILLEQRHRLESLRDRIRGHDGVGYHVCLHRILRVHPQLDIDRRVALDEIRQPPREPSRAEARTDRDTDDGLGKSDRLIERLINMFKRGRYPLEELRTGLGEMNASPGLDHDLFTHN